MKMTYASDVKQLKVQNPSAFWIDNIGIRTNCLINVSKIASKHRAHMIKASKNLEIKYEHYSSNPFMLTTVRAKLQPASYLNGSGIVHLQTQINFVNTVLELPT